MMNKLVLLQTFQVVPPTEWLARQCGYSNVQLEIPEPMEQYYASTGKGSFRVLSSTKDPVTTHDFRQLTNTKK